MARATSTVHDSPLPSSTLRLLAAAGVSLVLALGLLVPTASADDPAATPTPAGTTSPAAVDVETASEAILERATSALLGSDDSDSATPDPEAGDEAGDEADVQADGAPERVEATLALRDLFLSRSSLGAADERKADHLLARPSDGFSDPYGDGYITAETKKCSTNVCVHWVRTGADAPPSDEWAKKTLAVMEQVWKHHVGTLDYRRPAKDGSRGGNAKFDVYLKELGSRGLYGYCAPERRVKGQPKQASGFCVLDDDFAESQFGRPPLETLRVTAAHEFFHAVQFAYDFTEDPWLLESAATWIEERFADDVNDNRAYLKYGQAARSTTSLDLFDGGGFAHYGNWVFWEFLSEKYGNTIVRNVTERTGTGGGLPDEYSTQALTKVLKSKGGFPSVYAAFAAANTQPRRSYDEGASFPGVAPVAVNRLTAGSPHADFTTRLNHLTAKTVLFQPGSLKSRTWRLKVSVDAPKKASSPAVSLLILRSNGQVQRRSVSLGKSGSGSKKVIFSSRKVRSVGVTLASASTRYRCDNGSGFACEGRPLDQRRSFSVSATATRR